MPKITVIFIEKRPPTKEEKKKKMGEQDVALNFDCKEYAFTSGGWLIIKLTEMNLAIPPWRIKEVQEPIQKVAKDAEESR